ncbi:translation initiation factor IF-2 [Flammeovirga yaeyamensis]|uniref:Translation initiation factor IF-2 n=1 Tax=Flammeovirga yaeyamensis TaxID=367791 RepID=A0AAX1NA04_9BACT|nr:translation initiation factor IF-2 [Flammeovirga yaeyamensis]MBB3697863.1 translation initiation factor IF-2 [Flammeovirga yaeyamensis]NMF35782.1 translation initiation factor IF-2 [Flammeovirga yaeyamensis]QWG03266.1 translation initiation factor IF-2 [Flammeovirga yaeyamensis]
MADQKMIRINQAAKKLNVGHQTLIEQLKKKDIDVGSSPNAKITTEQFELLKKMNAKSMQDKEEASQISISSQVGNTVIESKKSNRKKSTEQEDEHLIIKNNTAEKPAAPKKEKEEAPKAEKDPETFSGRPGLKVVGKIDLDDKKKPASKDKKPAAEAKKPAEDNKKPQAPAKKEAPKQEAPKEAPKKVEEPKPEKKVEAPKPAAKETAPQKPDVSEKAPQQPKEEQPTKEVKKQTTKPAAQKEQAAPSETPKETPKESAPTSEDQSAISAKADELKGLTVVGKVDLSSFENRRKKKQRPVASSDDKGGQKKQRKKKRVPVGNSESGNTQGGNRQGGNRGQGGQGGNRGQGGQGGNRNQGGQGGNRNQQGGQGGNRNQSGQGGNRNQGGQGGNRNQSGQGGNRNQGGQGGNRNQGGQGGNRNQQGGQGSGEKTFRNADATSQRGQGNKKGGNKKKGKPSEKDIQSGMKRANAQLNQSGFKSTRGKHKQAKRNKREAENEARLQKEAAEQHIITVTEFVSTSELASMMEVSVSDVIMTCMNSGMFISINQRLDKETIELICAEFNFEPKFASAEEEVDAPLEKEDKPEDLLERAPIVTIMGHVDHGKTSLLDYIRDANVASGEAGGITQHIGAYDVKTKTGKKIAFLDTPGHEAFTAMRARGAKVTDVAIIVVAADDQVMPQTKEAINHALSAEVPIVIAINKVDKPNANVDNIKTQLSAMNILVEDWGGKYQAFEISAKTGQGIDDLLEGVLLESEVLELKANPNKNAVGTIVEASLDKGRGYLATVLVQAGTMKVGDVMLAGGYYGKVKAMLDHRGQRVKEAGPSTPVQVLGLSGAPQAGDKLNVLDTEREAREIANKREQLAREQSLRASQRPNLDLFKRLAQGELQQLNMIIKGDVDGSVEALSDSLLKLSNEEVEVRIIHKGVGALTESDILLAAADKENPTMIIGFQVRPTPNARKLAEKEGIEVRHYSVIYNAIDDVKAAMEGLLSPDMEEKIVGNVEVREVFKISKVGTVAGCYVTDGYIKRNSKIRLIRDGVVIYGGTEGGEVGALKRFKDDVNEVKFGYECGLSITNYNDIKEGDVVEVFEMTETKRTLS